MYNFVLAIKTVKPGPKGSKFMSRCSVLFSIQNVFNFVHTNPTNPPSNHKVIGSGDGEVEFIPGGLSFLIIYALIGRDK